MERAEAIKIIKTATVYTPEEMKALETLIPELKESEDERVRKWIYNLVSNMDPQDDDAEKELDEMKPLALAYLEKQKEQPQEELVYRLNGLMQEYIKEGKDEAEKEHRFKCYHLFWDALEDADFFEQKEQKSEDLNQAARDYASGIVDKEDAMMCKAAFEAGALWQKEQKPNIELIQRSWYMEGYHDRDFGKEPKWIIKTGEGGPKHELNPKYGQPLTGQQVTEEQLHNLNEAIKSLRMDGCEKIADSLHSLYDILKTQRAEPAEWSEEDEKELKKLISWLGGCIYHSTYAQETAYKQHIARWLKSLRPSWKPSKEELVALKRVGSILRDYGHGELAKTVFMIEGKLANLSVINKSIWKPSEEQMSALKEAYESYDFCDGERNALESLYEQLKQL